MGKIHRKSPQIVNFYGDSKLLRRSLFSTAGSFGNFGSVARIAKLTPKILFHVTEMRDFPRK